jgi:tripartite ATP-independent transporter DctM subunit
VRWVRGTFGILAGISGDDGACRVARNEEVQIRGQPCHRISRGGRHAWLFDPAIWWHDHLCGSDRAIYRAAVYGRTLLFIGAIYFTVIRNPEAGPRGTRFGRSERLSSLVRALPILAVVLATIGGMYTGFFTPVEASSVGAFLTFVVALARRSLDWQASKQVILATINATATVFMIIIGAFVFIPFMSLTELPAQLVVILTSLPIGEIGILLIVVLIYMFLGMFLEAMAMLVLTIPVVIPIAVALEWDLIWFGIIVVIVLEMGMISPPVGINVFIVKSIAQDVPMATIFRGIWPFWFAMAAMIGLLILFPQIALFLPQAVVGG